MLEVDKIVDALNSLIEKRKTMVAYLELKVEEQDWHGVQDAASDLRDIDTEMSIWDTISKL